MILSKINVYNKYLVILLTFYSFCELVSCESNLGAHQCCNSTEIVLGDSECLDPHANATRNISLTCEHGQYVAWKDLDENDNYTIEGSELVLVLSKNRVPWDSYCIGEEPTEHDWREVAVMCFVLHGTDYSIVFKGIMAFISVAFLAATLYVYKIIPQLRETQDKVTIICISCLAIAFIFLGCLQVIPAHHFGDSVCTGLAIMVYLFIIAYFSWLNVVTANVFKAVVLPHWQIKERTWYILNHIYAWDVPIILTIILVVSQHSDVNIHPRIGEQTCFIDASSQWLYLYTPLTIMIAINVIQIIIIAVMLYKFSRNMLSTSRTRALKYKFILYFKLSVIAGLTWIFEIFAYVFHEWGNYWIVTDSLNALHGALIFLALIVFRKRIRRELAGKRICCCRIPQEWNRINDSEGGAGCSEETKQDNINIRSQNGFQECE